LAASTPGASPRTAGLQLDASNLCSTSDDTPEGKEYFADSDIMLSLDCDILYVISLFVAILLCGCGMWDVGCGMSIYLHLSDYYGLLTCIIFEGGTAFQPPILV
jgi:hypothetical protein